MSVSHGVSRAKNTVEAPIKLIPMEWPGFHVLMLPLIRSVVSAPAMFVLSHDFGCHCDVT